MQSMSFWLCVTTHMYCLHSFTNCFKKAGFVQSLESHEFENVESAMQQTDNVDYSDFNEIFKLKANAEMYGDLTRAEICAEV